MSSVKERIAGCLKGIATGDAIGKQTEMLSRQQVVRWYPRGVRGFEGKPGTTIPRYAGNAKREWKIGETTDDTERTVAVARAIMKDGCVAHTSVAEEMLGCTKSVHPGVESLWEFHQAADPARIARGHHGCGAAIRAAPVGILYPSDRLDDIVIGAREASISTHGGSMAIAAAAANAAAVSAALDGASSPEVMKLAELAAARAEARWPGSGRPRFARAVRAIHEDLRRQKPLVPDAIAKHHFPDRPLTIVPLALALGTVMQSAAAGILLAANIGGDSDSVASIAGGILGARNPGSIDDSWYAVVEDVNGHDLLAIADRLSRLRTAV